MLILENVKEKEFHFYNSAIIMSNVFMRKGNVFMYFSSTLVHYNA